MSYSMSDYLLEESLILNKVFPKIVYKKQTTAIKSYTCSNCGCEIHKNELVWWFKPRPLYNIYTKVKEYFKWRTNCIDCEPDSYENLEDYRI